MAKNINVPDVFIAERRILLTEGRASVAQPRTS
jgi:hypothetical protein